MINSEKADLRHNHHFSFDRNRLIQAFFSFGALFATFLVSIANFSFQIKFGFFVLVVFLYLLAFFIFFGFQKKYAAEEANQPESVFTTEIEGRLRALEEASQFFGASLKLTDMFRLISSRIGEMIPFAVCALFLPVESKNELKVIAAVGENSRNLLNFETSSNIGLAGKTFLSRKAQLDETLLYDKNVLPPDVQKNLSSAVSVPLMKNKEIFGVLVIYSDKNNKYDKNSLQLFEAAGERSAPLLVSSQAYEQNLKNALTDPLTSLPNERAFYMILENQIAEAQRFRDERSLTVLCVDIKNFTGLNEKLGHAAGDQILAFTAAQIKKQLRQMDFLSRSLNDEFLAVLPTASDTIISEIIDRIQSAFASNSFVFSGKEKINVRLNFGAATFWKDGETAHQLLQHAQLRKQQAKSGSNNKVSWFPHEYIH